MTALNALPNAANNAFSAGLDAAGRAACRYLENEARGLDVASEAFEKEGFARGMLETVDALSLGSNVISGLDALGIAPESIALRELASASINAAAGGPLGLVAASEDLADAFRAFMSDGQPGDGAVKAQAAEPASQRMANIARGRAHRPRGYADDGARPEHTTGASPAAMICLANLKVLPGRSVLEAAGGKNVAALGPNPTFEDLVAAFMMDVITEQQKEIEAKMAEMQRSKVRQADARARSEGLGTILGVAGAAQGLAGAAGSPAASMLCQLAMMPATSMKAQADGAVSDETESRQLMFEQLKNLMNKLQEMQQALSNVLNAMHQGAMNSIRNIK